MVTFINSGHLLRTVSVCGVLDQELGVYFSAMLSDSVRIPMSVAMRFVKQFFLLLHPHHVIVHLQYIPVLLPLPVDFLL